MRAEKGSFACDSSGDSDCMGDLGRTYRIGQIATILGVRTSVLRFWEQEFPVLAPIRLPSGHRAYTEQDLRMLQRIRELLYTRGMTIEGARQHLLRRAPATMSAEEIETRNRKLAERHREQAEKRRARSAMCKGSDNVFLRSILQDLKQLKQELEQEEARA